MRGAIIVLGILGAVASGYLGYDWLVNSVERAPVGGRFTRHLGMGPAGTMYKTSFLLLAGAVGGLVGTFQAAKGKGLGIGLLLFFGIVPTLMVTASIISTRGGHPGSIIVAAPLILAGSLALYEKFS